MKKIMNKIDALYNAIKILSSGINNDDEIYKNLLDDNLLDIDYDSNLTKLLCKISNNRTDEEINTLFE